MLVLPTPEWPTITILYFFYIFLLKLWILCLIIGYSNHLLKGSRYYLLGLEKYGQFNMKNIGKTKAFFTQNFHKCRWKSIKTNNFLSTSFNYSLTLSFPASQNLQINPLNIKDHLCKYIYLYQFYN